MLDVAVEREVAGDLCLHDLGHGLPVRPGTADGAISISAVQWLCNAVRSGGTGAGLWGRLGGGGRWGRPRSSELPVNEYCCFAYLPVRRLQDSTRNEPRKRLRRFFESLYACLAKGARAVLQVWVGWLDVGG